MAEVKSLELLKGVLTTLYIKRQGKEHTLHFDAMRTSDIEAYFRQRREYQTQYIASNADLLGLEPREKSRLLLQLAEFNPDDMLALLGDLLGQALIVDRCYRRANGFDEDNDKVRVSESLTIAETREAWQLVGVAGGFLSTNPTKHEEIEPEHSSTETDGTSEPTPGTSTTRSSDTVSQGVTSGG